ncbi:peptidase [Nitzschia inconspicua]|uniref:Peptidase n=1 Tax=Nitzschia inconspicua TaxID=303405 RepID=A0A9K3LWN0_9STRA|nr:peptidase [Nitzschia inconspicua]
MGKKKNKRVTANNKKSKAKKIEPTSLEDMSSSLHANFVSDAGPGCYIARRDSPNPPSWLIEWEDVDPEEFRGEDDEETAEVPDVAIDTDEQTLSLCNVDTCYKVAYVTVYDIEVVGADGISLTPGSTTDNQGTSSSCITFIVLVPPCVFVHLCYLVIPAEVDDITSLRIESDVSPWQQHPNPNDEHTLRIGFPLGKVPASADIVKASPSSSALPSYLCTQGEGGELTHFFSGNLHAIDFQCPVGTELLAVADGIVIDVKYDNTLTGIAVTNLYEWNSIILQICKQKDRNDSLPASDDSHVDNILEHSDGPLFVEYVHIQTSLVQKGDTVKKGQIIGYSGSVGFSPEPHLHFSAFRSSDPKAPTVRVLFDATFAETKDPSDPTTPFLPVAGMWYTAKGAVG